jgi:hypothetical protein
MESLVWLLLIPLGLFLAWRSQKKDTEASARYREQDRKKRLSDEGIADAQSAFERRLEREHSARLPDAIELLPNPWTGLTVI